MLKDNAGNMAVLYSIFHTTFLQRNNSLCPVDSDGNILLNFSQSEKKMSNVDHAFVKSGWNDKYLSRTCIRCFLSRFGSFCQTGRGE